MPPFLPLVLMIPRPLVAQRRCRTAPTQLDPHLVQRGRRPFHPNPYDGCSSPVFNRTTPRAPVICKYNRVRRYQPRMGTQRVILHRIMTEERVMGENGGHGITVRCNSGETVSQRSLCQQCNGMRSGLPVL